MELISRPFSRGVDHGHYLEDLGVMGLGRGCHENRNMQILSESELGFFQTFFHRSNAIFAPFSMPNNPTKPVLLVQWVIRAFQTSPLKYSSDASLTPAKLAPRRGVSGRLRPLRAEGPTREAEGRAGESA